MTFFFIDKYVLYIITEITKKKHLIYLFLQLKFSLVTIFFFFIINNVKIKKIIIN